MVEQALVNYGVLGLWTLTLLYDKQRMYGVLRGIEKSLIRINERLK